MYSNKIFTGLVISSLFMLSACGDGNETADQSEKPADSTSAMKTETANKAPVSSDSKVKLEKVWEIENLEGPESVVYDKETDLLYVSNVIGSPIEKDGFGTISVVRTNGEIVETDWIVGLNSPKGLALHNGKLYVADVDELVEIDIETRLISNTWIGEGAKFLNDVTAASNGDVYVSDMMTNRIYLLSGGQFTVWVESDELENPNGLLAEKERMVVGAWGVMAEDFSTEVPGHMKSIDYNSKTISSIGSGESIGNMDGVEHYDDGYLVTDWIGGAMSYVDKSGNASLVLQLEKGMADHEVVEDAGMVYLPLMLENKLQAYKVNN